MNTPVLLATIAAVSFGGGFAVHTISQKAEPGTDTDAAQTLATPDENPDARKLTVRSDDPDVASKIRKVLATAITDPRLALKQAEEMGVSDSALPEIVRDWTLRNVDAALAWALSIADSERQREAIEHIFRTLIAQGQTSVALRHLAALPVGSLRDRATAEVVQGLVQTDPEEALSLASEITDWGARRDAARNLSEHFVTTENDAEFWRLYESLPIGSFSNRLASEYLEELAVVRPAQAIATAQAKADLFDRRTINEMFEEMGEELGRNDPQLGVGLASQITDEDMRNEFLRELGEEWGETDPKAASEWALAEMRRTGKPELQKLFSGALEELMEWDQDLAFSMIDQIPDPEIRMRAELDAIGEVSRDNPVLASTRLTSLIETDPDAARGATSRLARNWIFRDPTSASAWIDSLPASTAKDEGIGSLVRYAVFRENDTQAARAWIGQMSSEESQQELIEWIRDARENFGRGDFRGRGGPPGRGFRGPR